jgi:hypothetical protein
MLRLPSGCFGRAELFTVTAADIPVRESLRTLARTSEGLRGGNVVRVPPLPSLPPQTKALCTCLVRTHLGHSHLLGNGNTRQEDTNHFRIRRASCPDRVLA